MTITSLLNTGEAMLGDMARSSAEWSPTHVLLTQHLVKFGATVLKSAWLPIHRRQLFFRHHRMRQEQSVYRCCHNHVAVTSIYMLPTLGISPMFVVNFTTPAEFRVVVTPGECRVLFVTAGHASNGDSIQLSASTGLALRCRLLEICIRTRRGRALQSSIGTCLIHQTVLDILFYFF